ncbi:hypothetical protein OEA41_002965 [Lepraria neglecta]|uniref:TPR-like protein n=1 Tax=Lepraria neglecta TaxID=209136 RepID=A0AAD9Z3S8_9LECA|nr:hypothetical protein OEA41_002965 [Lepraria neglecta]
MLLAYSLVESHQGTESYSIHPVVHDWCMESISNDELDLMMMALTMVGFAVPSQSEPEYWVIQRRLLPHANRCVQQLPAINVLDAFRDQNSDDAFHNLGLLYRHQGKLAEAEKMYRRALDGYEKAWGPEHTSTDTVNNLGILYKDQDKLAEAEKMYRRALDGYEKLRGPNHPTTKLIGRNLSIILGT